MPKEKLEYYSEVIAQDFADGYHISIENQNRWRDTHKFLYTYNKSMRQFKSIIDFVETFRIGMAAVYEHYESMPMLTDDPSDTTLRWIKGDEEVDGPWRPTYIGPNETRMKFKQVIPYITDCDRDLEELSKRMNPSLSAYEISANDEYYEYIRKGEEIPDEYYERNVSPKLAKQIIAQKHYEEATPEQRAEIDRKREEKRYAKIQSDKYAEKRLKKLLKGEEEIEDIVDVSQLMRELKSTRPEIVKMCGGARPKLLRADFADQVRYVIDMINSGVGLKTSEYNIIATMSPTEKYKVASRYVRFNQNNPRPVFNGDLLGKGYKEWEEAMEEYEESARMCKVGRGWNSRYTDSLEYMHEEAMDMYEQNGWNVRDWYHGKDKKSRIDKTKNKPWKDPRSWKQLINEAKSRVINHRKSLYDSDWYGHMPEEDMERITKFYNNIDAAIIDLEKLEKPRRKDYERLRHLIEVPSVEMIMTGKDKEASISYAREAASVRRKVKDVPKGFSDDKRNKLDKKAAREEHKRIFEKKRQRMSTDKHKDTAEIYCKEDGSIGFITNKEAKELLDDYNNEGSATFGLSEEDMIIGEELSSEDMEKYMRLVSSTAKERLKEDEIFDYM